jgi:preprotein translocase subunit SecG
MNWLQTLAVVFHALLAFAIIGIVLLQRGKGADAGAGFGAGASGTVFGARGSASFLSRTTAVLATLFFLSSLGLTYLFSQQKAPTSVVDTVGQPTPAPVTTPGLPALPGAPAAAPAAGTAPAGDPAATTAPAQPAQDAPAAGQ